MKELENEVSESLAVICDKLGKWGKVLSHRIEKRLP